MDSSDEETKRLRDHYRVLATEELAELAAEAYSLSAIAQQTLSAEIAERGEDISINVEPPPTIEFELKDVITVATFRDLQSALLAKSVLDSSGIESDLIDENLVRMDWFWSNLIGGIKLQVDAKDREAALEILEQPVPETFELGESLEDYRQPRCPKCNSLEIHFEAMDKKMGLTTAWLFFPVTYSRNIWLCDSCGHKWHQDQEQ